MKSDLKHQPGSEPRTASRNTRQRQEVYENVIHRQDHPTAETIYRSLQEEDEHLSRGTVYRNLNLLSEMGEIEHVRVQGSDRFDSRLDKHYHMICLRCGIVTDVPIPYQEDYDRLVAAETDFRVNRHRMIFEGFCPDCQKIKEE